ncbi:MAG: SpoIIE family protein phosphatase [Candidatus Eisenbacteria bacterium]|nr:SpoIIE family protein phosphatase [Candidatus Eisenbacteria bacterium]
MLRRPGVGLCAFSHWQAGLARIAVAGKNGGNVQRSPGHPANALLLIEAATERPSRHPLFGGEAALFSSPSPERRGPNEDAAALLPLGAEAALLVVADGVGGSRAGRQAAALAVQALAAATQRLTQELRGETDGPAGGLRGTILDAIERANREILSQTAGGACTLAVVELIGRTMRPYHVGDAAVLLLGQRGRLKTQTVAHSPVGFALESGMLDERAALLHEERHLVSNVVGAEEMRIEIGAPRRLAPRDTLIVASDGLYDNLRIEEIATLVCRGPLEPAAELLAAAVGLRMQAAEGAGIAKPDDLTFILFRPTIVGG